MVKSFLCDIDYIMRCGAQKELRNEIEKRLNRIKQSAEKALTFKTVIAADIMVIEDWLSDLKKLNTALIEMGEDDDC